MKYLNQINTAIGAAGFLVMIYAFSVTFLGSSPTQPVTLSVERSSPERTLGEMTTLFSGTTTSQSAVDTLRVPPSAREATAPRRVTPTPRRRPPSPGSRAADPNTPVWQGAADPVINAGGGVIPGAENARQGGPQPANRPRVRPPTESLRSAPPRPAGPGSTSIQMGPAGRPVARPNAPAPMGAESQKRDAGSDPMAPPVRSSLPETQPPR